MSRTRSAAVETDRAALSPVAFGSAASPWNLQRKRGVIRSVAGVRTACTCAVLSGLALIQRAAASDPWSRLHRPLHLPKLARGAACPVSGVDQRVDWKRVKYPDSPGIGRGPVYPGLRGSRALLRARPDRQYGGPWFGTKVFSYVLPSYRGRC